MKPNNKQLVETITELSTQLSDTRNSIDSLCLVIGAIVGRSVETSDREKISDELIHILNVAEEETSKDATVVRWLSIVHRGLYATTEDVPDGELN